MTSVARASGEALVRGQVQDGLSLGETTVDDGSRRRHRFLGALPKGEPWCSFGATLLRRLALGLEFQLAGDTLRAAITPRFEELGKLAAVAAIRTALNFFSVVRSVTSRGL